MRNSLTILLGLALISGGLYATQSSVDTAAVTAAAQQSTSNQNAALRQQLLDSGMSQAEVDQAVPASSSSSSSSDGTADMANSVNATSTIDVDKEVSNIGVGLQSKPLDYKNDKVDALKAQIAKFRSSSTGVANASQGIADLQIELLTLFIDPAFEKDVASGLLTDDEKQLNEYLQKQVLMSKAESRYYRIEYFINSLRSGRQAIGDANFNEIIDNILR